MKFRKIEFIDHPILGSLSFDFTDEQGNTIDTIIIAGENGCGKSVLLNELFSYNPATIHDSKSGRIISELELNEIEIQQIKNREDFKSLFPTGMLGNKLKTSQDFSIQGNWDQVRIELSNEMGNAKTVAGYILSIKKANIFKSIFSDVEINFTPQDISYVTARKIYEPNNSNLKSTNNIATEITQLLIDIDNLDNSDLAQWVGDHDREAPPENVKKIRMKRFTNAFHSMFPHKRFINIENANGKKKVVFEEFGKRMPIEKLSSGEKQIVFRGGFLLKDKKSAEGSLVLIDEPEISLHPKWQLEIMNFLKTLFTDENGMQTSQIIVTTHSPFIIHNSTRTKDKVIVLSKDNNGVISVSDNPKYYSWSNEQIIEEAFKISYQLPNDKITVFVEGETDEKYYKRALEVFNYTDSKLNFQWIGRNLDKGKSENTGDTALNNAAKFFKANPILIIAKVILLYDSDTNKPEETPDGKLFIKAMAKNAENTLYQEGIENLMNLPNGFDKENFYNNSERTKKDGGRWTSQDLNKTKLCAYFCALESNELLDIFSNLKVEIDKLLKL